VDTQPELEQALAQVRSFLAKEGFDLGSANLPIRLVDREGMAKGADGPSDGVQGRAFKEFRSTGVGFQRNVREILVLYGLPLEHFTAVLAHELGHAYVFIREFPKLSDEVEEGFCEYLAAMWLRGRPSAEALYHLRRLEKNDDPVYGSGYRVFRDAVAKSGLEAVLGNLKAKGTLP
jgi:hypothetical protein